MLTVVYMYFIVSFLIWISLEIQIYTILHFL